MAMTPMGDADHDMTCGTCGRTWSSLTTPTPAGRCPFEYDHEDEDEDDGLSDVNEIDAVIMMTRDRRILGVRAFRAGQDQSELLDSGMEDSTHPFRVELWRVGEFDPASNGFINAAERGTGGRWYQASR